MDIAALSMSMAAQDLGMQISTQVLDMSLNTYQDAGDSMQKMLEMAVNPSVGGNIDLSV